MRRYGYGYGWQMPRRALLNLLKVTILIASAVLLVIGVREMRVMLTSLATSRASNMVNRIVTEAVNETIDSGYFEYDHLISFEKDNEGKVTVVKSNMPEFNRLQAQILDLILERISDVSTRDLSIPLGSLTGSTLLSGRGPGITVRMQSVGSSTAWLENQFISAGINQTKHQILLNVDVNVSILLPGFRTATKVSNSFVVAETVIVGSVPQTYTYFSSDYSVEDDARDYVLNGN